MRYTRTDPVKEHVALGVARAAVALALEKHYHRGDGAEGILDAFEQRVGGAYVPMAKSAISSMILSDPATDGFGPLQTAFVAGTDKQSIVGALVAAGAVVLPPNSRATWRTGVPTPQFSQQGTLKILLEGEFDGTNLAPRKIPAVVVVSDELGRFGGDRGLEAIRQLITDCLALEVDRALLDPGRTEVADVSPASLTSGVSPTSAGADVRATAGALIAALSDGQPSAPVLIGSYASLLQLPNLDDLQRLGIAIVPSAGAGTNLIAIDARGIVFADGGGDLTTSRQGRLTFDDGASPVSTTAISLFQTNQIALMGERWLNWQAIPGAVAYADLTE